MIIIDKIIAHLDPPMSPHEIRAVVDRIHDRVNDGRQINAAHVAAESKLRAHYGHPSYIAELDGPRKFIPNTLTTAADGIRNLTTPTEENTMSEIPIKPEHGTANARPALSPDSYPAATIMEDVDTLLALSEPASLEEYLDNRSVIELRQLILATEHAEAEHRVRANATNDLRVQIRDLLAHASNYGKPTTDPATAAPRI